MSEKTSYREVDGAPIELAVAQREWRKQREAIRDLRFALETLLLAFEEHHVTVGDCNQARSALASSAEAA
jgi:hypothetical protein